MSEEHPHHHDHDHHGHGHKHDHVPEADFAPETQDASSQALSEALRSSFSVVKIVMWLMVIAFFASGFFTVGPQEKAVILRFGKPVGEGEKVLLNAGLHWSFPYPIDEVVKIPITEQQIIASTIGWYKTTPEQELSGEEIPAGPSLNPAIDGYLITGDRNIIHSRATLRYHIQDPFNFTFNFVAASNTVQNVLNNALLYTAAQFKVDDVLLNRVAAFREAVQNQVEEMAEAQHLGIIVEQCDVESKPPRQLQAVFDQVTIARQNRNKALIDANSYTNQILSQAIGQSSTIINQSAVASANYVTNMLAEAKRFNDLEPLYTSDPGLFTQQYLVKAMGEALTNVEKWVQPTSDNGKSAEVRLMLNREPPQPKAPPGS
ncbi:MAG TPA: protease modulator HflK [Candidatus Angelobacter sp.]|jgi:membrane protease subunit HflK|nr:protease modulator HflK [Candidatus Angelobacter sp.]